MGFFKDFYETEVFGLNIANWIAVILIFLAMSAGFAACSKIESFNKRDSFMECMNIGKDVCSFTIEGVLHEDEVDCMVKVQNHCARQ